MRSLSLSVLLAALPALSSLAASNSSDPRSTKLDLSSLFDIKSAAKGVNDTNADFDDSQRAYPVEFLPSEPTFSYNGIEFDVPPFHDASKKDAVRSNAQTIAVNGGAGGHFQSFHALGGAFWTPSGSPSPSVANVTLLFDDGSSDAATIIIGPWWSWGSVFTGPIYVPFHYANPTLDYNLTIDTNNTHIQYTTASIPSSKNLTAVQLPPSDANINWFSVSLLPADTSAPTAGNGTAAPALHVQTVRATTKWVDNSTTTVGAAGAQIIEVTLDNLAPLDGNLTQWVTSKHTVALRSSALTTVQPGTVRRLRTDDQVIVPVAVKNNRGVPVGANVSVTVVVTDARGKEVELVGGGGSWTVTAGVPAYENVDTSLAGHEAPEWYNDAKFGIFIHWGVYSVPAWAPSGQQYAEWYDWQLHNPPNSDSPTWVHHRETYGTSVVYDDFIANFTASAWSPDDWVDLFHDSGAKYFVLVTKHHDGFALFDTENVTHRNSLLLGPKRDIVKELLDTAKTRHPELHRGTYFSMPEWFNPAYGKYGHISFPGHPALNAFNGSCCDPFTGYIPKEDFLQDIQKPQMEILFYNYDTEILWCDIGYATAFPEIAGDWYNYAAAQGRQVVRDDRCGSNQTDFATPEYATYAAVLSSKWESSEGMDPFSYGYNSDTPPDAYQNASGIIPKLVDIVSKGGNYLLDIGPKADGTIVPEMTQTLLDIGTWLNSSGEAIYGTRTWSITPASTFANATDVRFTTTTDAFYITAVSRPKGGVVTVGDPVPITKGDTVTLLGGSGKALDWTLKNGVLSIHVGEDELNKVQWAWAFKIAYADS